LLATYEKARDLINIGAYASGSDSEVDEAIATMPVIESFLLQGKDFTEFSDTLGRLETIGGEIGASYAA